MEPFYIHKRLSLFVVLLVIGSLACVSSKVIPMTPTTGGQGQLEPNTPTEVVVTTEIPRTPTLPPTNTWVPTNTLEPTETPTPTDTPIPTRTPTPTAWMFRDDFEGVLATGWQWINEDPTHWSLTEAPGMLRIIAQASGWGNKNVQNVLVRSAPEGDFEITTFMRFAPSSNYQFAGLIVFQDQDNYLQFGRAFCDLQSVCIGNGIYFDMIIPGEGDVANYGTVTKLKTSAYLRLTRIGDAYTGYFSPDGVTWTLIGGHIADLSPQMVGLVAHQAYQAEIEADFEYFTIKVLE